MSIINAHNKSMPNEKTPLRLYAKAVFAYYSDAGFGLNNRYPATANSHYSAVNSSNCSITLLKTSIACLIGSGEDISTPAFLRMLIE